MSVPVRRGRAFRGRGLAAGVLVLLAAGGAAGAERTELLDAVRTSWRSHRTIAARFEQTQWFAGFEEPVASSGTLRVLRPRRFDLRFDPPHDQRQVCDGEWVWTYDPAQAQAFRSPLGPDAARSADLLDWALEGARPVSEAEADTLAGAVALRIDLRPGENLPLSFLRVWVAPGPEPRLLGFEAVDGEGNRTRMRFLEVRTGVELDTSSVRFDPPQGVEVIRIGSVD